MMPGILLESEVVEALSLASAGSRSTHVQLMCNLFPTLVLGHEVVHPFFVPSYLICKE